MLPHARAPFTDPASRSSVRPRPFRRAVGLHRLYAPVLAAFALLAATLPSLAVPTNYWDTATSANCQPGNGTWDIGNTALWSTNAAGSNPLQTWTDGNNAIFPGGVNGVSISGTVTANSIQLGNSGATTLSNGTLRIGPTLAIGNAGSLTVNSPLILTANLMLSGGNSAVNAATINGNISENGGAWLLRMVGNVNLTGTNTFSGGVRLNTSSSTTPSMLTVTQPAALGNGTKQVELDASGATANPSTTLSLNFATDGIISNTWFFYPSTFSATIQSMGAGAAILATTNAVTINSGGTVILNLGGTSTAANVFAGKIVNGNSTYYTIVNKTGPGTWILSGSNAYFGATTVAAGTLWVNGSLHSNSAVTVSNNATLGGSGTISGGVTVVSGGILSPGPAGVGTLTVKGGLTLGENASYTWEYGASGADRITVGGALQLPSVATVNVVQVSGTLPKPAVLFSAGSLSGTPYSWVVKGLPNYTVAILNNTNVVLAPINPGTAMLMR